MEAVSSSPPTVPQTADLPVVLSSRYALTGPQFAVCAGFAVLYVLLAYLPLFPAITWRHVQTGDWIVAHRALPTVDPLLPLADGVRWATTSWGSDVLLSVLWQQAGLQGLSSALALTFVALLAMTCFAFAERSGRLSLAAVATVVVLLVNWPRISILRPELIGLIGFAATLLFTSWEQAPSAKWSRVRWVAEPAMFLVWANLDGSVVLGVALLAVMAVGQLVDAIRSRGGLVDGLTDETFRRALCRADLALVMSLCQPLGLGLWLDVLGGLEASVWWSLGGWAPLQLTLSAGWVMLGLWMLAAALLRWSQRPITAGDVLLVVAASALAIINQHALVWSVPVLLWGLLPHLADTLDRWSWLPAKTARPVFTEGDTAPPLAFAFTGLTMLVVWCAFVLSPLANPLFGGRTRPVEKMVSKTAPIGVTNYLKQRREPATGLAWVPEEWGDWLSLTTPAGLQVSANSQLHLLSDRQKYDILLVSRAEGSWTRTLDRYGVEWLVIDKQRQPRLFEAALAQGAEWAIGYEDAQAAVLRRKA